jgi:hypothetical protein
MKSSQPPSLATWLLEHVVARGQNEALAGDLLEDYNGGRSAAWYWRQVFIAIMVGFSKELRSRWMTIVFAGVISGAVSWQQIWHSSPFQSLFVWGTTLPWPASLFFSITLLSAFEAVVLLVALSAYLVATRSFSLRGFLNGLLVALLVLSLGNIGVTFLGVMQLPPVFFYYVVWRLPLFFGLVLAMWVARPIAARAEATRLPA